MVPKKYNDYYDRENQVQHIPQVWKCTKCEKKLEVLSAVEVTHRCPKNKSQVTNFKRVEHEKE